MDFRLWSEVDGNILEDHRARGFVRLGTSTFRAIEGHRLRPLCRIREDIAERDVSIRIVIGVHVHTVDRFGVVGRCLAAEIRVGIHDQNGVFPIRGQEDKDIGQIQPSIITGRLEVWATKVVGHRKNS